MEPLGIVIAILLVVLLVAGVMSWIQALKQQRGRDVVGALFTTAFVVIGFAVTFTQWPELLL